MNARTHKLLGTACSGSNPKIFLVGLRQKRWDAGPRFFVVLNVGGRYSMWVLFSRRGAFSLFSFFSTFSFVPGRRWNNSCRYTIWYPVRKARYLSFPFLHYMLKNIAAFSLIVVFIQQDMLSSRPPLLFLSFSIHLHLVKNQALVLIAKVIINCREDRIIGLHYFWPFILVTRCRNIHGRDNEASNEYETDALFSSYLIHLTIIVCVFANGFGIRLSCGRRRSFSMGITLWVLIG